MRCFLSLCEYIIPLNYTRKQIQKILVLRMLLVIIFHKGERT
jgi:hypothetical protein